MSKKAFVFTIILACSFSVFAGNEKWDFYSEKGWKGTFFVGAGSSLSRVTGFFVNRYGSRCNVLTSPTQYLQGNIIGAQNFSGQIATTCGVLDVWRGKRSLPHSVTFTTGSRAYPFGTLFSGKASFD